MKHGGRSAGGLQPKRELRCRGGTIARMGPEIIPNIQVHPVDLCQKSPGRHSVILAIRLGIAKSGNLLLESPDTVQSNLQFSIIVNHSRLPQQDHVCRHPVLVANG
jgi:hypothetical protein